MMPWGTVLQGIFLFPLLCCWPVLTAFADPLLDEQAFIRNIVADWLRIFTLKEPLNLPKNKVRLHNNLKDAIRRSGIEHRDVAQAVGIRPSYLSQVIAGSYEPSFKLALLILDAIRWPAAKIEDVWWLRPGE